MKALRAALVLIALAAALTGGAAHADEPGLSVQLAVGWDGAATPGGWIPYQVTIRNDSTGTDFHGLLVVTGQAAGGGEADYGPTYQQAVSVPRGSQKSLTIYGAYRDPAGAAGGFVAKLLSPSGAVAVRSPVAALNSARLAVGLLSDSLQALGQVKDTPLPSGASGVVQLGRQSLPASAVEMSGLGAVVIDDFDALTLSQAQGQALREYVGLGGQLVLAGGPQWRRTLVPLPGELLPLRPQATVEASLDPLLDLQARHTSLTAPAVVGALAPGARVVLADAAGDPLLVELAYGAGTIVEMTYDPADQPLAGHPDEVRAGWSAALNRVAPAASGLGRQSSPSVVLAPPAGPGQVPLTRAGLEQVLTALLNDTPANSLPPLALLGGLLVVYILLAGPVNYVLLSGLRRRELAWVTVPLLSVLFTAGSYGAGIAVHGRDYYVNEIQVLRGTPEGAVDVSTYDAVFSPERGNLFIQLGEASLASSYLSSQAGGDARAGDRVVSATNPLVSLRNLAIWTARDFKTESSARSPIAVEAHLRVEGDEVRGTLVNRGRAPVRRLRLLTTDGRMAILSSVLRPGESVSVSGPLHPVPSSGGGPGIACNVSGCLQTSPASRGRDREAEVMSAAASSVLSPVAGIQSLTGIVDPVPGFRVNGIEPTRTVVAAFVLPVRIESIDTLPANWSAPRLVATNGIAADPVSVIDYGLPPVPDRVPLQISAGAAASIGGSLSPSPPARVEIYDWAASAWRPADLTHAFAVSAGERSSGLVRLRVRGSLYLQGLQVSGR